jgi:hypothetical protein
MRQFISFLALSTLVFSCKKYKDPDPIITNKLTNKYCNEPTAVNFNWGFPGVPDNTVCIYPAQVFNGNYMYQDNIIRVTGEIDSITTFPISMAQIDSTKFTISGFCTGTPINATANRYFKFMIDSTHIWGQKLCGSTDTMSGGGLKLFISDSIVKFNYTIYTDTGKVVHTGKAKKL